MSRSPCSTYTVVCFERILMQIKLICLLAQGSTEFMIHATQPNSRLVVPARAAVSLIVFSSQNSFLFHLGSCALMWWHWTYRTGTSVVAVNRVLEILPFHLWSFSESGHPLSVQLVYYYRDLKEEIIIIPDNEKVVWKVKVFEIQEIQFWISQNWAILKNQQGITTENLVLKLSCATWNFVSVSLRGLASFFCSVLR
mgnify:CR=1 FL=1